MKYLILGAGPSGLSFANRMKENGEDNFLVLEKEKTAGGLCRSELVDGFPLDIGGGHFLDVRRPEAVRFLFRFMPEEEWNVFDRDSRIAINGKMVSHPLEANLWQMDIDDQVTYLVSIAQAACNSGEGIPKDFVSWIYWKFGERIAEDYMLPYNRKMFGENLNRLGTYWLEKLPDVSFEETIRSCLEKRPYGRQPGHERFYYPKRYGYGEVWLRMAGNIGNHILYGQKITKIDFINKSVETESGGLYQADRIITTIPWAEFDELEGMPDKIKGCIAGLRHTSVWTEYHMGHYPCDAQWIYYPDPAISYHRILVRESFCPGSSGYWTETNAERMDGKRMGDGFQYSNPYAYPLNTIGKPEAMSKLLGWCEERGIYGLGRWGEHRHYNSDRAVELALRMADSMVG